MSYYNTREHAHRVKQTDMSPAVQARLYWALLATIAILPLFIHSQWITGVLVNFILIFSCLKFSMRAAIPFAFIPSIAAVSSGLLPLALAPVLPFIMAGNVALISLIYLFKRNYWLSLCIAASAKFIFLYASAHFLANYFLPEPFADKVLLIMGWHQFATAMVGGLFAALAMKGLSFTGK